MARRRMLPVAAVVVLLVRVAALCVSFSLVSSFLCHDDGLLSSNHHHQHQQQRQRQHHYRTSIPKSVSSVPLRRLHKDMILPLLAAAAGEEEEEEEDTTTTTTIITTTTATTTGTTARTGFYVHIPYCRRRCRYCNFAIVPIGLHHTHNNNTSSSSSSSSSFDVIHEQYQADLFAELDHLLSKSSQPTTTATTTKAEKPVLSSIYFGGGTPSLAPVDMIQGILERILTHFTLQQEQQEEEEQPHAAAEITMEMDPGTFDLEQLQALQKLGINRISLGVQSFDDTILESMGRVHRRADIFHAIHLIHQVFGRKNHQSSSSSSSCYSMDLISGGVPGLTCAKWMETLETATTPSLLLPYPPSHLSIYDLQVEEGTVFSTWYNNNNNNNDDHDDEDDDDDTNNDNTRSRDNDNDTQGSSSFKNIKAKQQKTKKKQKKKLATTRIIPALPNEESVAFMYKYSAGYLKSKGYEHYEVSSYAKSGRRSQHNQVYWEPSGSWYAVGLGATSFVQGKLQARPKTLADYHNWVEALLVGDTNNTQQQQHQQQQRKEEEGGGGDEESSTVALTTGKTTSEEEEEEADLLTDWIMKRLRTSDGLDLDWVEERFGTDVRNTVVQGAALGLELDMAEIVDEKGNISGEPHDDDRHSSTTTSTSRTILRLKDPNGFLYSNYIISSIFAELGYE